jgi:bla regulator protein blaR1
MILKYFSELWSTAAPAVGNHLWQSTVFAVVAGLLTLVLRRNHARARYWLWLASSAKFLIPFSLLVGLGSHLPWARGSAGTKAGLYFAMEEVSQPFTQPAISMISRSTPATASLTMPHLLPALLTAVWLGGFFVVLFAWYVRWRRICVALREAVVMWGGREVEALRRLERLVGLRKQIELRMSRASLEPGIFGIARPVMVWPEGISKHLDDVHLQAIVAHEVCHVCRRDNLAAAIHMLVEAIFWFHPLTWWLGARLVDERERACDEEVLEMGTQRQVYAESILKTCEFCLGSPLTCVSGVTGADLKKRVLHIMTQGVAPRLDFRRKFLLGGTGLAAVVLPVVFGFLQATETKIDAQIQNTNTNVPVYEVASIKPNKSANNMVRLMFTPNGLDATNVTLQGLVKVAYSVEDNQISGGPSWFNSDHYDINAKMDSGTADALHKLNEDQGRLVRQQMLQALLGDRFKLTVRHETKELSVYALIAAKSGPKLHEAKPGDTYPNGIKGLDGVAVGRPGFMLRGRGWITGQGLPMTSLAELLTEQLGRPVVDKTGLMGIYDFKLQWTPDESQGVMFRGAEPGPQTPTSTSSPDSSGPSVFTAIQEQLGLRLESQKGSVEVLVIDHVEKPSEN